jgi:hypothetical protein
MYSTCIDYHTFEPLVSRETEYYIETFPLHKIGSDSLGLVNDSQIVYEKIKDIPISFSIYYETCDHHKKEDMLFINIDITNVNHMLYDTNRPSTLLCKTKQAYELVSNWVNEHKTGQDVIYTRFSSIDRFVPTITTSYDKWLHIAGKSPYKGTISLVTEWIKHPEYPVLTILIRDHSHNEYLYSNKIKRLIGSTPPDNLVFVTDFLTDNQLQYYMNHYGIQICSSTNEGYGHSLNEARSTEAVVLYTNGPSMNELFHDGISGIAITCTVEKLYPYHQPLLHDYYTITPDGLQEAIQRVVGMSEKQRKLIGTRARKDFLENDDFFTKTIRQLVTQKL